MAADTKYGVNHTKALRTVPSAKISKGQVSGECFVMYDEFTLTEELEVNDLIAMGPPLPAGALILDATVFGDQLGTTGIVTFGSAADPDSLTSFCDMGGQAAYTKPGITSADIKGTALTAETQFYLKATEVSDSGVGDKIRAWIVYTIV